MSLLWRRAVRRTSPASDDIHPDVEDSISGGIGHLEGDESRSVVGMVPVHKLMPYREHDGYQNPHIPGHDQKIIDGIRKDIRSGEGIKTPLMLEYDHDRKWGALGEGNHRLEAAAQEGISHVPVRVYGRASMARRIELGKGAPLHLPKGTFGPGDYQGDYVPPSLHPHHFPELRP